jgi:hypothetical protein
MFLSKRQTVSDGNGVAKAVRGKARATKKARMWACEIAGKGGKARYNRPKSNKVLDSFID